MNEIYVGAMLIIQSCICVFFFISDYRNARKVTGLQELCQSQTLQLNTLKALQRATGNEAVGEKVTS